MRYKKLLLGILALGLIASPCFAAWDETTPADNCKLKDAPGQLRANFAAIMAATDADLCINDAKMCPASAIGDDHLAQITTASKVSGAAMTLLGSVPAGGGQLPIANGGTGQSTATAACTALLPSQTGNSGKTLITNATVQSWGYPASLTIASAATGDMLYYNGTVWTRLAACTDGYYLKGKGAAAPECIDVNNTTTGHDHDGSDSKKVIATNLNMSGITSGHVLYNNGGTLAGEALSTGIQVFTANGTFTAPAGVTTVLVTVVGGGGGGGGGYSVAGTDRSGGGGGGGGTIIDYAYTVTPSSNYTVVVGAAGTAGAVHVNGGNGGQSSFDSVLIVNGGGGGGGASIGSAGAAGAGGATSLVVAGRPTAGLYLDSIAGQAGSIGSTTDDNAIGGGGGASAKGNGGTGGSPSTQTAPTAGAGYGGGGGGGYGGTYSPVYESAGAAGKAGLVIVEW